MTRGLPRLQVTASTPAFAPPTKGVRRRRFICDAERLLFCHVDSDPAVFDIIDIILGVANVGYVRGLEVVSDTGWHCGGSGTEIDFFLFP